MTFETIETSRQEGEPVALYYFRYGSDPLAFLAHTDATQAVTGPGSLDEEEIEYSPLPIARGAMSTRGTLDKAALELSVPRDCALADLFRVYPPAQAVTCIVRAGHLNDVDADFPAIWVGRVISMALRDGGIAVLNCEPIATSLRRNGLRRNYMYGCPHALYGTQCRADRAAATVTVNVTSVGSRTLVLPAAWFGSIAIEKYIGGLAQWIDPEGAVEVRTILRAIDGKDLMLGGLVRGLEAGNPVEISLGCNHQMTDCEALHVETGTGDPNIKNFGGQPWIPVKNPFDEHPFY